MSLVQQFLAQQVNGVNDAADDRAIDVGKESNPQGLRGVYTTGFLDYFTPDVAHREVNFLDAAGSRAGDDQGVSAQLGQSSALPAGQADAGHSQFVRGLHRPEDVGGVAGRC